MKFNKTLLGASVALGLGVGTSVVYATNGMNLEGYGPVATAMGGASFAYDNGTAASMNNPATLGLMADGTSQFDLAVGYLGPDINTEYTPNGGPTMKADSEGTAYWMPALGYVTKSGPLAYGVTVYAQGGMGTKYDATEWEAAGSGERVMSEVGVGRVILPVAFNVNDQLSLGASLDFVWVGMDLRMAVPANQLGAMVTSADPRWTDAAFGAPLAGLGLCGANCWGRFDFEDPSDVKGAAMGYGVGGKLGLVYQVSPLFSVGATYHAKTRVSDLKTGSTDVTLSGDAIGGGARFEDHGKITIHDFEWPSTYGVGFAFTPSDSLLLAFDVKRINWSEVMENFSMTYESPTFGKLDVAMPQNWKDQTVYQLGASYKATNQLTLRAGFNYGKNPVPDATVNPLFPATVEKHYTVGAGYALDENQEVNFAFSYAPASKSETTYADGSTQKIEHGQTNWQLMYSMKF